MVSVCMIFYEPILCFCNYTSSPEHGKKHFAPFEAAVSCLEDINTFSLDVFIPLEMICKIGVFQGRLKINKRKTTAIAWSPVFNCIYLFLKDRVSRSKVHMACI